MSVHTSNHPVLLHKLTLLRKKSTTARFSASCSGNHVPLG